MLDHRLSGEAWKGVMAMTVSHIASRRSLRRVSALVSLVVLIWLTLSVSVHLYAGLEEGGPTTVTTAYAAGQVLPGCILLSASEDPGGIRHGIDHSYEGYPVVMTLACISFDDVETAAAMLPIEIEPSSEALAQGDVAPY